MGSDESHFNVSLIVRDKVTRPCPQTTTFEEKGEPKRYRTEVVPLTSLQPYRLSQLKVILSQVAYASTNKTKLIRIVTELYNILFTPRLMFTCVLGRCVASTVLLVPNLSEDADSVGGHLRGDRVPRGLQWRN